jgi:hypothetical protein
VIVLPAIYHVMILTHKIMTCAGSLFATAFRWWGRAVHAEEENEELRQAIYEPFSLPYQDLYKENMELKFRIMDLQEALAEITGSTEAAEAAEHLGGQHSMNLPRETQLVSGTRYRSCTRPSSVRDRSAGPHIARMNADRASWRTRAPGLDRLPAACAVIQLARGQTAWRCVRIETLDLHLACACHFFMHPYRVARWS